MCWWLYIVKEGKPSYFFFFFFLHCARCFTYPSPFSFFYFPPPSRQFLLFSVLLISIVFPSSPSTSSFILYIFHPQIHRPPIDPTSTLDHATFFQHSLMNSDNYFNRIFNLIFCNYFIEGS